MSERSEEELSFKDFYLYFSRWQDAYPGGIPVEYIEKSLEEAEEREETTSRASENEAPPSQKSTYVCHFGSGNVRAIFFAEEGEAGNGEIELFKGAIEKGLRWSLEEVLFVVVDASAVYSDLSTTLSNEGVYMPTGDEALFVFGNKLSDLIREWGESLGFSSEVHTSPTLSQALADKGLKREMWEGLKKLKM